MSATDAGAAAGDYYGPGGAGETRGAPRKVRYSPAAHDEQLARYLWLASERLTGVTFAELAGDAGSRREPAGGGRRGDEG